MAGGTGDPRATLGVGAAVTDVVAIVGAGITGLACAASSRRARGRSWSTASPSRAACLAGTTRPPASLSADAQLAGVALHLGETAIRWDGQTLLVDRPGRRAAHRAGALVVAAGARPRSRAELGLTGPRPAGILAATVACHLSETGLLLGRRPAVVGGGDWAARAVERAAARRRRAIELVAPAGLLRPMPESDASSCGPARAPWPSRACSAWRARADGRRGRSSATRWCSPTGWSPLRNVDGAVWNGARTVYAQPLEDPPTDDGAIAAGKRRPTRRWS